MIFRSFATFARSVAITSVSPLSSCRRARSRASAQVPARDPVGAGERDARPRRGLDDWRNLPHTAQQILGSIFLFTGAHVPSVRDPDKYDPKKARNKYLLPDDGPSSSAPGVRGDAQVPSLVNYRMANHVMTILSNRKSEDPRRVYRGIRVPNDPAFLEGLKPGVKFECWPISSFTTNLFVAMRFAEGDDAVLKGAKPEGLGVLMVINSISTGTYIHDYSYFSDELEFVSSPKLVIEKFEPPRSREPGASHLLYCKEI